MKLPKSFLAVNLSETHTFHKKETEEQKDVQLSSTDGGMEGEVLEKIPEGKVVESTTDNEHTAA